MEDFDHGIPDNKYNKHAWIFGNPEIGEGVWIGAFCLIDALHASLKIGKGSDISSGAQILTHSTVKRCVSERRYNMVDSAPVVIGDYCFIGTNAVILMGSKIGHHSVLAAGAVVSQGTNIPPYSIVAGVPGKIIGSSKKYLKSIKEDSISVVIPAYNEEETIENVVKEATFYLDKITRNYEMVLVNDGSTDKTGKIINRLSTNNKKIRAVHHGKNKGFTGAMKTSFRSAKNDLIFLAPADGQFDFGEIKNFINAICGYDIAIGYRITNEELSTRKFKSFFLHIPFLFLCRNLLGIKLREFSAVSLWRKKVIDSIDFQTDDRSAMFLPEIISKAFKEKYRFTEVPIHWKIRKGGKGKGTNLHVAIKSLFEMLKLWINLNLK